ncbi:MAG: DUF2630 family protein [Solirubrobacterales bacterium]|nr:DUF2630 family protein [Solirubrobacterales bacterium]
MSEVSLAARIEALGAEERELRGREQSEAVDADLLDEDERRLRDVELELDRCWELLRQGRALRDAGADPDQAQACDADTVEWYMQ